MTVASCLQDIGVVVVTHNRADLALACVGAASREVDPSMIVVVVNDPHGAGAADLARIREIVGDVVLNTRRAGYGANINAGVRRLSEDVHYLLFLNDDAIVKDCAISLLRRVLERRPSAALVGPQLVDKRGCPQPSRHRFPTLASELVGALLLPGAVERRLARRYVDPSESQVTGDDVWPIGAALLVRAEAFREIGGFDESYFLYSEETDLALRLKKRGWTSSFCPEAVVQHTSAQSTGDRYERMLGLSRWHYVREHWSPSAQLALVLLLPGIYTWNAVYIAARIAASPRSFREKTRWWRHRWVKRPLPAIRLFDRQPAGSA